MNLQALGLRFSPQTAVPLVRIPVVPYNVLSERAVAALGNGNRLIAHFVAPREGRRHLFTVLGDEWRSECEVLSAELEPSHPSLTPLCAQFHLFEREIAEDYGVSFDGIPVSAPVRFVPGAPMAIERQDYFRVGGSDAHEFAVGPVHAGVIEPGHFRFQAHGEEILHLEISLGYQHRGIERALIGGPHPRTSAQLETVAGDTSVGHAVCYFQLLEALTGTQVNRTAQNIRVVGLELERIANHIGDIGALANDVAFVPTAAYCGRLRGSALNLTAELCGSRFGRGLICFGGTRFQMAADTSERLMTGLALLEKELADPISLLFEHPIVLSRFSGTGVVSRAIARELGVVGVAARASGLAIDSRKSFSGDLYSHIPFRIMQEHSGDVLARAAIRRDEIHESLGIIRSLIEHPPAGSPSRADLALDRIPPNHFCLSMTEGWRGEITHVAVTGADRRFAAYKIFDPSYHNWAALAYAMRREVIFEFPLCNKSFNLSYCGVDR
ncbi:MAG: hydrogenase [Deltaproteobacteria bacterium]|nr:hydrogenase [Deltaproteobacteria bacterium]